MVFSRELPHSFSEALRVCKEILSANHDLILRDALDTEAEQIVVGAYRAAGGELLSRTEFIMRIQDAYPAEAGEKLLVFAGRRAQGEPLQHILGFQYFLDHEYEVDASTLIPRPETEVLVTEALKTLRAPSLGIEIGLGAGIIAIELLNRFSGLKMIASEISPGARALAERNANRILGDASRLQILAAREPQDVLGPFEGTKADFMISNPPYLDPSASGEVDSEVLRYEPRAALFPEGNDPLFFYREIALRGREYLRPGGLIFVELAHERIEPTKALFQDVWRCRVVNDLTGRPRVLVIE